MHVHSSPPNIDNWQAATAARTNPLPAQASPSSSGSSLIDDLAEELTGAGAPSPSPASSGGSGAPPSGLGAGLRSLLSLQAGGSAPAGAAPASPLAAMLARYQVNGLTQAGSGSASATDLSV